MNRSILLVAALLAFGAASLDADAQMRGRMGGGLNLGKQRPVQRAQEPPKAPAPAAPAATPAKPAAPAATTAPAPKPTFMQRWGGLLAGLGIGALLASVFGAQLGPIVGMLLAILAVAAVAMLLFRLLGRRPPPQPAMAGAGAPGARFSGIGSALPASETPSVHPAEGRHPHVSPAALAESEIEPFLRVAKTSFIRLQAAHDAGDLDDIRDYTTPELYAEIAMQLQDRGGRPQRTEVVSLDARLVEAVVEGDYAIASVRFSGLVRENDAPNPEPLDEIWHVRKSLKDRRGSWLIAGIQQVE